MILLLSAAAARADIPTEPPVGPVRYSVVVTGLSAHPEHVVMVYPWSNSDGVPDAQLVQLVDGRPLAFGRQIDGEPALYAMRREALQAWSEAPPRDVAVLLAGAVRCEATVTPRHDGTVDIVDRFTLTALSDTACALSHDKPPPAAVADRIGCTAAGGGGLLAIALGLLGIGARVRESFRYTWG